MPKQKMKIKDSIEKPKQTKSTKNVWNLRFTKSEDLYQFNLFKEKIKQQGKTLNSALIEYVMKGIEESNNRNGISRFKEDIFYAFQKSSFASSKSFVNKIKEVKYITEQEAFIINTKLDIILNVLFGKVQNLKPETLSKLSDALLEEPTYFSKLRQNSQNEWKKLQKKTEEKIEQEKATNQKYIDNHLEINLQDVLLGKEGIENDEE